MANIKITAAMIEAGARVIERRTDLDKYTRAHLAEDVFAAMHAVRVPIGKMGRPRLENLGLTYRASKPWIAAGMSERTWYRRRAEASRD